MGTTSGSFERDSEGEWVDIWAHLRCTESYPDVGPRCLFKLHILPHHTNFRFHISKQESPRLGTMEWHGEFFQNIHMPRPSLPSPRPPFHHSDKHYAVVTYVFYKSSSGHSDPPCLPLSCLILSWDTLNASFLLYSVTRKKYIWVTYLNSLAYLNGINI